MPDRDMRRSLGQARADEGLLSEIVVFGRILKRLKVNVNTTNLISLCKSLELVGLESKEDFYYTLKTNLISRQEDIPAFDRAFALFWSYPRVIEPLGDSELEEESQMLDELQPESEEVEIESWSQDEAEDNQPEEETVGYSPDEVLRHKDFSKFTQKEMEEAKKVIAKVAPLIATKVSRRKTPSKNGDELDFRRTWRKNLLYEGDFIRLVAKKRKIKKVKVILLCDVSGSMDCYSKFLIQFIYGMQQALKDVETAVFSTRISVISRMLKAKEIQIALDEISESVLDWSGGTDIGRCLREFNGKFARDFVKSKTVVVIISDGWDRGDEKLLKMGMEQLRRQAYKIIWLNPLLGSANYQPICKGMKSALPYLDYFLPAHNLDSLLNLARTLMPIYAS